MMDSKDWLIIGISGVTCSGKTMLAKELHKKLSGSILIHQDNYYLLPNDPRHIKIAALNHINWEILSSLDMDRMYSDIKQLLNSIPNDLNNAGKKSKQILILEGFLLFGYKPISDLCQLKYFLTLNKDECFKRRCIRTYDPADVPGYFETVVWPEYLKHLSTIMQDENASTELIFVDGTMEKDETVQMVLTKIQDLLS
ncbi:PREDICTED: nicotinamide riboside kinase 1 [Polistes canadensis]|uniref:nicotinamide riboside kinase 1 n=1 Tax=Polistes canadensis TaxID=91411 RepID=UPI000718B1F8|nr:PREDICTED: nicotinamide riboside kinase 1 [Polistes canadensis]